MQAFFIHFTAHPRLNDSLIVSFSQLIFDKIPFDEVFLYSDEFITIQVLKTAPNNFPNI